MRDRASASENTGFLISEASRFGTPAFSDDAAGEHTRTSPYRCGEEPGWELTPYIPAPHTNSLNKERLATGWQENMRGLPHKLRFKTSSGFEGVDLPVEMENSYRSKTSPPSAQFGSRWTEGLTMPPTNLPSHQNSLTNQKPHVVMENSAIRSQLSFLSEEVAELKKLLLQKLLSKMNADQ